MRSSVKLQFNSFLFTQIKYSILIISICTIVMGVLSYRYITKDAAIRVTQTNNEMLYQYRNTIDNLIISNFSDMSLNFLEEVRTNPDLKYYMNNPLKGNISGTLKIHEYLTSFKNLNSLAYSVAIYYAHNKLLVSTDYIRYTFDNEINDKILLYYDGLLRTLMSKNDSRYGLLGDSGENMFGDNLMGKAYPENVINIVRILPDARNNYIAVFITVDSGILHKMIQKHTPNSLESIMVVDEKGIVISHSDSREIGKKAEEYSFLKDLYKPGQSSGSMTKIVNDLMTVISYQTSEISDWKYIAFTPMLSINSVARGILKTIVYTSLFTVMFCILFSLFAAKYLERPIRNIAQKCSQIPYIMGMRSRNEYSLISNTLDGLAEIMERKEQEMKEITPMLTANFITWLLSEKVNDSHEIYRRMIILRIEFNYTKYFIMALKVKSILKDYSPNDNENYSYEYEKARMSLVLEKSLNTEFSKCIAYNKEEIMIFFVNHDSSQDILSEICKDVIAADSNGYVHYAAFGADKNDIASIAESYHEALDSIRFSYLYPEKRMFVFNEISKNNNNYLSNKLLYNNFINSLRSENLEKAINDLDSIVNALRIENCSLKQVSSVLTAVSASVIDFLGIKENRNLKLMDPMESFSDIADFTVSIKEMLSEKLSSKVKHEAGSVSNVEFIISCAKEYIEKNLLESQLSLETVAQHLGISSNYLSRIFRSECDITFVEYVTSLKMQLGRSLLIGSDMKIDEISTHLGYSTSQYFISKFKVSFGCTPSVYRSQYKGGKFVTHNK